MTDTLEQLRKDISTKVFHSNKNAGWLFDFRRVLLRSEELNRVSEIFWEKFSDELPFQIGGIEVAAIPLIAGIVMKAHERDTPLNGFFIRKSRKKDGLLRMVEGEITNEKIILVDDILNSGKSFIRQIEVLEGLGKKVDTVFVILRFRDLSYYTYFHERGIKIVSLFTLDDFIDELGMSMVVDKKELPVPMPFNVDWLFKSENPNHQHVIPKSAPALDEEHIYFGADNGNFWAIDQESGKVVWQHKVRFGAAGKFIFSSPALYRDTVYFGAYDGNFYALDKKTGKKKWVFMEADWIGSSPCVSEKLKLVYVGLEFGLWKKQGGIVALDAETGKKVWEYSTPGLVHSSPAYSEKHNTVVCGSNNNTVYAFNAKTGLLLWQFETGGEVKASFAFDDDRRLVCFGSFDGKIYTLDLKDGSVVHTIETGAGIYSTPLVHTSCAYAASLDKQLYCIDLETGVIRWKFRTNGRIFASPAVVEGHVMIGSNDGRLYELDAATGRELGFFQATERITNKVAYNPATKKIFLPTFANEIYRLSRKND